MKYLFLITARGGSKGVPRKNLRKIGGLSLLGFKIRSALASKHCDRVVVSTDSEEIAAEALALGAEVPFMRPDELATDNASSFDVVRHAMDFCEAAGEAYDGIMLLEPSSPFAMGTDYDAAIELFERERASLVVGVVHHKINTVYIAEMEGTCIAPIIDKLISIKNTNRQSKAPQFTMNGTFYLFPWNVLRDHETIYWDRAGSHGIVMEPERSIEIDEEMDLVWAEFLVERGIVSMDPWSNDDE